ncbi:MAG: hypothetical protein ACJ71D_01740 [Nitrososphaera sp.]
MVAAAHNRLKNVNALFTTASKNYVEVLRAAICGDAYIRKYNSDGDEVWSRQFGTSRSDIASESLQTREEVCMWLA